MKIPIKQAVLESLLLTAPLVSPYIHNKWNHAEVDGISNKKDLDLYKKNNPNYKNYDSVGKMTKVGAGVGLAGGVLLNGVMMDRKLRYQKPIDIPFLLEKTH